MSLSAEEVLKHCKVALVLLEEEQDETRWNVHWVGAMSLIRAVGHVLDKVDGAKDPRLRSRVDVAFAAWKSKDPSHAIFRDFIEPERNSVLKEFRSSIHPTGIVRLVIEGIKIRFSEDSDGNVQGVQIVDGNLYRPRLEGYGKGEDARDLYEAAIGWWETQLARLSIL